jgi:hypothetical protein
MWPQNTRLKTTRLSLQTLAAGGMASWDLPKTGILARISLLIQATVGGTVTGPNALGACSCVNRVRCYSNAAINLIDVSGPGYEYLYRDMMQDFVDSIVQNTGRNAVSATTFNLDMDFPFAINDRDPIGLIMLQNQETLLTLQVQAEASAVIATGGPTLSMTVQPVLQYFAVPVNKEDWPSFQYAHTITEESQAVSGAGQVTWYWPRGNMYQRVVHGAGIAQSPADSWSLAQLRVNGSDFVWDVIPKQADLEYNRYHGRARVLGVIPFELAGLSGLGNYGSARDLFDTRDVTDIASLVTTTGAITFYSLKDQIIDLMPRTTS